MADQEYNRGSVGGTNWWDSSSAAAARTAATDSAAAVSTSCSSVVFHQDHSLQVMGLGLSSQPLDQWNHPLLRGGDKAGAEIGGGGFRSMLQQGMAPFSAGQTQKLFLGSADADEVEAAEPEFKPVKGFSSVDQQFLDSSSSSVYGNFQGLMGASDHAPPHQQGGYGYHHQQQPNYGMSNSESLMGSGGGWTSSDKVDHHHQFLKPNSMADPNKPIHSQYSSGGSFWNMAAAAAAMADMPRPAASSFFPVASPLIQQHQINIPCFDEKPQHNVMEVRDTSGPGRKTSGSSSEQTTTSAATATTSTGGTASKRSRNEASSTLPPFKVRKEKMGDRITALQQLVSPFGKTDTASVLSEAIEYIKFLHEQVNVLSTPYLKSGASLQSSDKSKDPEGPRQDLRSRGLCLVPVSSTFPVAHETTVDFWTPTFGGTFR